VTGLESDRLVAAIFDAIAREQASPEERRMAVVRAGAIAQLYMGDVLTEMIFGSAPEGVLQNDNRLDLAPRVGANTAAH
jgi:hypothetical protein